MAKQRKNKAGHSFAGTAGGIQYYRNAEGKFTDEDAHLVEPGYAKVLESVFPQTVEEEVVAVKTPVEGKTPKKPRKRKVKAEPAKIEEAEVPEEKENLAKKLGKAALRNIFSEFYDLNLKMPSSKKVAKKPVDKPTVSDDSQYKRDVSDIRFKLEGVSSSIDANGVLLKESLTQEERAVKSLENILKVLQTANKNSGSNGSNIPDVPGKGAKKPSTPKPKGSVPGAALAVGGVLIGAGIAAGPTTKQTYYTAADHPSNAKGEQKGGSIAERNETTAMAAAKEKVVDDSNVTVNANDLILNSKFLKFNTDKIYLNVAKVVTSGAASTAPATPPSSTDEGTVGGPSSAAAAPAPAPAAGAASGAAATSSNDEGSTGTAGPAGATPAGAVATGGPQTPAVPGNDTQTPTNAPATSGEGTTPAQGAAGGKPPAKSQTEYYNSMYNSLLKAAQEKGLPNPEVVARIGATQTSLETGYGKHMVGNNAFGIKGVGPLGTVNAGTKEFVGGRMVGMKQGFRAYASPTDSAGDYIDMMMKNQKRYGGVLKAKTVEEAISAQAASGYATDPNYGAKLFGINAKMSKATAAASAPGNAKPETAFKGAEGGVMKAATPAAAAEVMGPPAPPAAEVMGPPAPKVDAAAEPSKPAGEDKRPWWKKLLNGTPEQEKAMIAKTLELEKDGPVATAMGDIAAPAVALDKVEEPKPEPPPKPKPKPVDLNKLQFTEAFKTSREQATAAETPSTGQFEWRGKKFQTNVEGEKYVPQDQQNVLEPPAEKVPSEQAAAPPPPATPVPAPTMAAGGTSMGYNAPQGAGVQAPNKIELATETSSPGAGPDKMFGHYYPHLFGKQAKNSPTTAVL